MRADPRGAGDESSRDTRPGSYRVTREVISTGGGSSARFSTPVTSASGAKRAARRMSNAALNRVAPTDMSSALTMTGATHAYGFSPGIRYRYTGVPAAFSTGPMIHSAPAKNIETSAVFVIR